MWFQNIIHHQMLGVPLWIIGLCGLVGVLVDIDHIISHYWLTNLDARFLHTPLLAISCIVLFSLGAYIAGLLCWMVLGGKG